MDFNLDFLGMSLKVLHVFKTFRNLSYGGIENFIYSLCLELQQNGIECGVVTTSHEKNSVTIYEGIKVFSFKRDIDIFSCPVSFDLLKQFKSISSQYDIIHYHHPWPFADLLHLFSGIKKPSLVTYHADIVRHNALKFLYTPLQKSFFSRVQKIVTTSDNLKNSSTTLKTFSTKTTTILLNMSQKLYFNSPQEKYDRWKQLLPQQFFLFIGVLRYYKGLDFLLKAIYQQNLYLVVVGSGPEEQRLRRLAENMGVHNVIFLGFVDDEDKMCLLQLCHAVVCPSHLRAEAFGINLLEGLIFSKPLISTELGTGTSFVNQHLNTGIVVPPKRSDLLCDAMKRLSADKAFYLKCKAGAQKHYESYFGEQVMGNSYGKLYKQCVNSWDYV